jgi:hypothetical protein
MKETKITTACVLAMISILVLISVLISSWSTIARLLFLMPSFYKVVCGMLLLLTLPFLLSFVSIKPRKNMLCYICLMLALLVIGAVVFLYL